MESKGKNLLLRNKHIYLESEQAHWIYFLVEGSVRTYKTHPVKSNNITFQMIHEGSFFGYFEVFTKERTRKSSAEVTSKYAIYEKFRIDEFYTKLIEDREFFVELFLSASNYKKELWERFYVFREYETFKKIAWMLINIGSPIDQNEEILEIKNYTHLLLGQYTGSSRQTITSVLNEYRKLGIIEYNRDRILIKKTLMQQLIDE